MQQLIEKQKAKKTEDEVKEEEEDATIKIQLTINFWKTADK